jgi:hypothetical protein
MHFIEWVCQQQPDGPSLAAANQVSTRVTRDRGRLTRIETMLRELIERRDADAQKN